MPPAHTPNEWWKDKTDADEQAAFIRSCRATQRERYAAGWRRNIMLGFLVAGIPLLIRLVSA